MTFHAKDGWFFQREADGSVWVFQRAGGRADGEIVATVVLDPDSWASVVASMSSEGETADTFAWAGAFHQGAVQSFIAALAESRGEVERLTKALQEIADKGRQVTVVCRAMGYQRSQWCDACIAKVALEAPHESTPRGNEMTTATFDLVVNDPAQTVVGKATLPAEFPGEPAFIKTPDGKVFQASAGYGPTTYVEVSVYDVPASDYQSAL